MFSLNKISWIVTIATIIAILGYVMNSTIEKKHLRAEVKSLKEEIAIHVKREEIALELRKDKVLIEEDKYKLLSFTNALNRHKIITKDNEIKQKDEQIENFENNLNICITKFINVLGGKGDMNEVLSICDVDQLTSSKLY